MNIVIVDARDSARAMLRSILQDIVRELEIREFSAPDAALQWCGEHQPDLLLLDYSLPGMDGITLARTFRKPCRNRDVPIVMVTAAGGEPVRQEALDAGIIDFLVKPIRPRELRARCRNLLQFRQQAQLTKQRVSWLQQQLLATANAVEERECETLSRLVRTVALRNTGTNRCEQRLTRIAGLIARGLGLDDDQVRAIELAAPLRDIGSIAIPDALLMKRGPLDADDDTLVQAHSRIGHELLQGSQNRFLQTSARMALRHHENYDGTGHPDGLAGTDIPIEARIIAAADMFDALITPCPYTRAWGMEEALEFIEEQSGKMLDPDCVRALLDNLPGLREICGGSSQVPDSCLSGES